MELLYNYMAHNSPAAAVPPQRTPVESPGSGTRSIAVGRPTGLDVWRSSPLLFEHRVERWRTRAGFGVAVRGSAAFAGTDTGSVEARCLVMHGHRDHGRLAGVVR